MEKPNNYNVVTDWPLEPGKFYLRIAYHEWWIQTENINDLFDWILYKYKTVKWWDYDPFYVVKPDGTMKDAFDCKIDWEALLTEDQKAELKTWKEINFKMQ